jgi:hypothetical protein
VAGVLVSNDASAPALGLETHRFVQTMMTHSQRTCGHFT